MEFLTRKIRIILVLLLFAASIPFPIYAADNLLLGEQKIKAGLIYNFLKYTKWPSPDKISETSIFVCIYGADPFDGSLQPMQGRSVNQREIVIRHISKISEADTCHLLFINAVYKNDWPNLHNSLAGKNILTVSDFDEFAEKGGMIEFNRKDNHVQAEINLEAISSAGLSVEGRLLKLVTIIKKPEGA